MICDNCKTEIKGTPKFCPKCGTKVKIELELELELATKTCPQCGTDNILTAKFCKKDGYRFDSVSVKPEMQNVPPPAETPPSESRIQETVSKAIPPAGDLVTCPKCGTANSSTAKFCKKDGYLLQDAGTVSPASAMPPLVPASKDIPSEKPPGIGSAVSVAPTTKAPIKTAAAKSGKGLAISAAAGVAILASAAGGYAYWAGYVGNRQGNVQNEINAELDSHGLSNVKVTVNHDWIASLTGSVSSQTFKDQALAMAHEHKELKQVVDAVQIELNAADVEKNLNKALTEAGFSRVPAVQVDKDLMATVHGSADDQPEKERMLALVKGVAGIKGVRDEIEVAAPQTIPEPENQELVAAPQPPVPPPLSPQAASPRVIDKAALGRELNAKLRANGVSGVTGRVNPDMTIALFGTVRSTDERDRAITIGNSLPGSNGVSENIQVVAPPVVKLAPPQAPHPKQQAMAIDPAKLEADINRALRNSGAGGVTAQVSGDLSVTLKGAGSASEKEQALQVARQFRGVRAVKDKIFVVE